MTVRITLSVGLLAVVGLLAGCAKPPGAITSEAKSEASDTAATGEIALAPGAAASTTTVDDTIGIDTTASEKSTASSGAQTDSADRVAIVLGTPELTAGIPGEGPLTVDQVKAWLADDRNHLPLQVQLPLGLAEGQSQIKGLDANPLTRAKIELGRQLYFDPRLSADGKVACASCHAADQGWAAHTRFGVGIDGQEGGRNSPVSYNRILSDKQFWDGRAATLEEQAKGPIANPIEMGNTHEKCVAAIGQIEGYKLQMERIFGEVSIDAVANAIASFERAIVTGTSPYDYQKQLQPFKDVDLEALKEDDAEAYAVYEKAKQAAEAHPMSESALRGMTLYFSEKANCSACHVGANLTDELYYNIGVGMDAGEPDLGRFAISKEEKDTGAFKTPTIRNVELTAPYMHDGSQKTLEEVVAWYAKGGHPNPHLHQRVKKLDLTDQDKQDLVAFMKACTGDFPKIETGRLPQ